MFGEDHSPETIAIAANMKYEYMPQRLFKYRSFSAHSLEVLQNDFLFSSQSGEFNDIFEGSIEISRAEVYKNILYNMRKEFPFLKEREIKTTKDLLESIAISCGGSYEDLVQNCRNYPVIKMFARMFGMENETRLREIQEYSRNIYNICCFCAENDNKTMWAHCADNHAGFCIAYGIKELNSDLTQLKFLVIYNPECYLNVCGIDDIGGSLCMYMLTLKSHDWGCEREWRIFFPPNPPIHKGHMPKPKSVFLGARTLHENEIEIAEICEIKGIPLYKMEPLLDRHKLVAK